MNPWHPARDQAEAERTYRMNEAYASQDFTLKQLIDTGWTLASLLEFRYVEAIPQPPQPVPLGARCEVPSDPQPSEIAQFVVDQVLSRDAHGQRKYGVSLDRTDLSTADWLQHMAEELMDGAHYALAAKREIARRSAVDMRAIVDVAYRSITRGYTDPTARDTFVDGMDALRDAILAELRK